MTKNQLVVSAEDMDLETFCLHMTHRHGQVFSGPNGMPLFASDYVWDLWLEHHDEDHKLSYHKPKDGHYHAEPLS